jgi:hypothetical protein
MTCDDCQAIVIDISRGADVDHALREDARRHAALCARCGEQQQEQQWLTTQFRAIAAADADRQAPERVEIAALAAWRAEFGAPRVSAHTLTPAPTTSTARRWLLPGVAVAGLAAAAMAMIIVWPASQTEKNTPTAATTVVASRGSERTAVSERVSAASASSTLGTSAEPLRNRENERASTGPRVIPAVESVQATNRDPEFLPLPYVEPLRSTEVRHVVRVSMTSGDEMLLGVLPADRRNGQPFEADVLVGEDGIARAIRVVR